MKLLLVDVGGERHLVELGPPDWTVRLVNEHGEHVFLEEVQLVGVRDVAEERPLDDVLGDYLADAEP